MMLPLAYDVIEDHKRWAELHKGVSIIKRDGISFMRVDTECSKLVDGKCSIYKDRPNVCKEYFCDKLK